MTVDHLDSILANLAGMVKWRAEGWKLMKPSQCTTVFSTSDNSSVYVGFVSTVDGKLYSYTPIPGRGMGARYLFKIDPYDVCASNNSFIYSHPTKEEMAHCGSDQFRVPISLKFEPPNNDDSENLTFDINPSRTNGVPIHMRPGSSKQ